jgi:hypothetical protein
MLGKTLSAVTLERPGFVLTTNFLTVQLASPRDSNQMIEVRIGSVTAAGLAEHSPFPII